MTIDEKEIYDITIIGAGPVGLFTAFYAGMRHAKTKLIDSLPQLGGQLSMLYPDKHIYDIAGFPKIKASTLVTQLTEQAMQFEPTVCLEETLTQLTPLSVDLLKIETNQGVHYTKSIIITTGNGAFQPRKLSIPELDSCENVSLFYFVQDLSLFKDKNVVIAGGGDSAIDWALELEPLAKSVTLTHRRPKFRALEHNVLKLNNSSVILQTPYVINNVIHENQQITELELYNPKEDLTEIIPADILLVNYGFISSHDYLANLGLDLDNHLIKVKADMSTNIPGVYAAGDVCTYPGKVKLIATGLGEAPTAVNNALHFIQPDLRIQPMHSTSLFSNSGKKENL